MSFHLEKILICVYPIIKEDEQFSPVLRGEKLSARAEAELCTWTLITVDFLKNSQVLAGQNMSMLSSECGAGLDSLSDWLS